MTGTNWFGAKHKKLSWELVAGTETDAGEWQFSQKVHKKVLNELRSSKTARPPQLGVFSNRNEFVASPRSNSRTETAEQKKQKEELIANLVLKGATEYTDKNGVTSYTEDVEVNGPQSRFGDCGQVTSAGVYEFALEQTNNNARGSAATFLRAHNKIPVEFREGFEWKVL